MAKGTTRATRWNATTRKTFLAHLAETANVSASARAAGIEARAAYVERRRSPEFYEQWTAALAEGYARIEAALLAEALVMADGKTSDATLKAQAQKNRLRLSLLSWHQSSARNAATVPVVITKSDLPTLKAELILKLTQMRDRAGISLDGQNRDGQNVAPSGRAAA